jgi:hypothetical protein
MTIDITEGSGTTIRTIDDMVTTKMAAVSSSNVFNRPADTSGYTANDAVADNTSAGSVTIMSWTAAQGRGVIRRARIKKTTPGTPVSAMRLWLWDTSITVAAGDNAAFTAPFANAIGYIDVSMSLAGSDVVVGFTNYDIPYQGSTIYGLLQTLVAFTPSSGATFTTDIWELPG